MKKSMLFFLLLSSSIIFSQALHPLEPITSHYKEFQKLSATPNQERAMLDTVSYLPSNYGAVAILYTMLSPVYLTKNQIDTLKNSVAYPANSSDQTKAELDFLLNWEQNRTKAQEVRAAEVLAPVGYWPHIGVMKNHLDYEKNRQHLFFEGNTVIGNACTPENYPATAKLLEGITTDMRIMEFTVKYHLLRPRPYYLQPTLKPLAIMSSPSFASGHTLWAYIHAFAWSELIPTKRKQFLALAYEIGESREIMGIHYPSDDEASRMLAHSMLAEMWSNPNFKNDLTAAQLEWENQE
ncbi:phosphatase PAP2 family protein [Maribacter sp.]|nr:phosphatase PAP2 family protein [Maribacter sp.]